MFVSKNQVRMHDTDMAGILYFARQFRFAHDALEDFVEHAGFTFHHVFHEENYVFVIVHCEADYYTASKVGDKLTVQLTVERIGTSSFTLNYEIFRDDHTHVGSAKTTHVTIDRTTRTKIDIPLPLRKLLEEHLITDKTA